MIAPLSFTLWTGRSRSGRLELHLEARPRRGPMRQWVLGIAQREEVAVGHDAAIRSSASILLRRALAELQTEAKLARAPELPPEPEAA